MNVKKLTAILCVVLNIALVFQLGIGYIFAVEHEPELIDTEIEEIQVTAANGCEPPHVHSEGCWKTMYATCFFTYPDYIYCSMGKFHKPGDPICEDKWYQLICTK